MRRVVKAKQPPPLDSDYEMISREDGGLGKGADQANGNDENKRSESLRYNPKSPSQVRQEEGELFDQARQERLEASAKLSRSNKDEYVQSRRQKLNSKGATTESPGAPSTALATTMAAPMSVEPEHPEHKRSSSYFGVERDYFSYIFPLSNKRFRKASFEDEEVEDELGRTDPYDEGNGNDMNPWSAGFWLGWKGATVVMVAGVVLYLLSPKGSNAGRRTSISVR